jgi:hypothetical protein
MLPRRHLCLSLATDTHGKGKERKRKAWPRPLMTTYLTLNPKPLGANFPQPCNFLHTWILLVRVLLNVNGILLLSVLLNVNGILLIRVLLNVNGILLVRVLLNVNGVLFIRVLLKVHSHLVLGDSTLDVRDSSVESPNTMLAI